MENVRILIVDDDPVTRLLLKKTLTKADYEVVLAENGSQAIEHILGSHFDVVITDLIMPGGLDGIDVLEKVKSKNSDTEVFLLTAHATVDTAVTAMKKGAADYLQKPINIEELIVRLNRIGKMKALAKNAGDLREAMDITEKAAGQTIQDLEIMVSELDRKLSETKTILSDQNKDVYSRIHGALEILS